MAQWMGQFSGRTHESKVKKLEETLEKAIEALRGASNDNFEVKRKSVLKISARLLAARHKAIRARISKLSGSPYKLLFLAKVRQAMVPCCLNKANQQL